MKSAAIRALVFAGLLASFVSSGTAQQIPAVAAGNDPRVGLKAGLHDAGVAAADMERLANLPKPDGFFDPARPGEHLSQNEIDRDAAGAAGRDAVAVRLRSLAATLRGRVAELR